MRIYCINLEHRKDRRIHSFKQFIKLGIAYNKVIYPHFTKDKRGGVYGCFDSHMKIWNDFFVNYPDDKYALIFEDDFIPPDNGAIIIKQAIKFIEINYKDVDILNLHDICVKVEHKLNNGQFTNGYGFNTHAYLITRQYIQSIINKYGKIPEPNGQHIDFEINFHVANEDNKNNKLLSTKIFYTNNESFTQIIDKSDNYLNKWDELFRTDIQTTQKNIVLILILLKKYNVLNDDNIKSIACIIKNIIT